MIDDLTERIRQVMQEYGYTPSVFADEIGVQRPAISHIMSGRNRASLDVVIKILKAFTQINSHWLLTGEGQMKQLDLFGEAEEKPEVKNTDTKPSSNTTESKSNTYAKEAPVSSATYGAESVAEPLKQPEVREETFEPNPFSAPAAHVTPPATHTPSPAAYSPPPAAYTPPQATPEPSPVTGPPPPPPATSPAPPPAPPMSQTKPEEKPVDNQQYTTVSEGVKPKAEEKVIEKMIVFYTDKTFSVYKPE